MNPVKTIREKEVERRGRASAVVCVHALVCVFTQKMFFSPPERRDSAYKFANQFSFPEELGVHTDRRITLQPSDGLLFVNISPLL